MSILRPYQKQPCSQLVRALTHGEREWGYPGAVDMSDLGTGKTFVDLAAMAEIRRKVAVLCPVAGMEGWRNAFSLFGIEPHFIGSYEAVRGNWRPEVGKFGDQFFEWESPQDIGIILDEAQMVKAGDNITAAVAGGAIRQRIPIIAASATLAISPLELRIAGRITGLHQGGKDWQRFMEQNCCYYNREEERWWFDRHATHVLSDLRRVLIPQRGCRMRKAEVAPDHAGSTITVLPIDCPEAPAIEVAWEKVEWLIQRMENSGKPRQMVQNMRRAGRMRVWKQSEMALVQSIAERIKADIADGKSVVCFFSFTESREAMGSILGTQAGIYGGLSPKKRNAYVADFQANKIHVLLCNIGAGGASVSLHDTTGERPRVSYIFPSDRHVAAGQAVGRIDRIGGRSHAVQWIPCVRGTLSERMVESTAAKLSRLKILNDGED
jgi:hypothetical protein